MRAVETLILVGLLALGVVVLTGILRVATHRPEPAYIPCPVPVWESGAETIEEFDRRAELKLQMMRHCGDKMLEARRGR